jgi:hypothetical protein
VSVFFRAAIGFALEDDSMSITMNTPVFWRDWIETAAKAGKSLPIGSVAGNTAVTQPARRTPMYKSRTFWSAFFAGMTAPAAMYAAAQSYLPRSGGYSVGQAFAEVGMFLQNAEADLPHGGQRHTAL